MHVLIDTPYSKKTSLEEDFDNKILAIFIIIISLLAISGLMFLSLLKTTPPTDLGQSTSSTITV